MTKYIILIIIILFFIGAENYSQEEQSYVAKVGNDFISAKEFKLRFELSPYIPSNPEIDRRSDRDLKRDFLYSLVAEMLWAKEAERMGTAQDEKFEFFFKPLQDLIVRDALFKREIKDKVKLTAADINTAIEKSQFKIQTLIVSSKDSNQIHQFYNLAKATNKFDSLLTKFNKLDSSSAEVSLASLRDENIENAVYALTLHQFTAPIKTEIGWVIFQIKNKVFTPIDLSDESTVNKAKDAILNRRIEERFHDYMIELLENTKISVDSSAFFSVYYKIWNTLKEKSSDYNLENYYPLTEWDFQTILNSTSSNELNRQLFKSGNNIIPVKHFLADLAFNGFSVNQLDSTVLKHKLSSRVKQFVEFQIITNEAYRQNLHLTAEASKDISAWKQKYLAEFYFKSVFDTIKVSDSEIYDSYVYNFKAGKSTTLMNIRVLTLAELDEIEKVLKLLEGGKSLKEITISYGKTDELANEFGETGLHPSQLLGDLGKIAASLDSNEIYGPVQRNNAYSLIQLIEKVISKDTIDINYDSVKTILRNNLRLEKTFNYFKNTTAKLAEIHNVKIYYDVLDKIKVTTIPMFIHRFMGFGGRIAGVPLLTPFSNWIENIQIQKLLP